jgi:hypothetical protein
MIFYRIYMIKVVGRLDRTLWYGVFPQPATSVIDLVDFVKLLLPPFKLQGCDVLVCSCPIRTSSFLRSEAVNVFEKPTDFCKFRLVSYCFFVRRTRKIRQKLNTFTASLRGNARPDALRPVDAERRHENVTALLPGQEFLSWEGRGAGC